MAYDFQIAFDPSDILKCQLLALKSKLYLLWQFLFSKELDRIFYLQYGPKFFLNQNLKWNLRATLLFDTALELRSLLII